MTRPNLNRVTMEIPLLRFSCTFVDFVNFFLNFFGFHFVDAHCTAMSGELSSHHLPFNSYFLVHNHARVDVFTMTSFPSLSLNGIAGGTKQPWNYLNDPVLLSYW